MIDDERLNEIERVWEMQLKYAMDLTERQVAKDVLEMVATIRELRKPPILENVQ